MKQVYDKVFNRYWSPYLAMALAGILSAVYFGITGTVWAVTGEFTRLGGHLLEWSGVDISDWAYFQLIHMNGTTFTRTDGWIVWGMFIGALIMILLSNSFKIRVPRQKRRLLQGLAGGFVAGFGARLALGCNLAAFFTGVPQFSLHSWIFIAATAIGTYLGTKLAIFVGMAVSSVATLIIILVNGMDPITKIAAPSTLIGGILFGIGIVMAGGCETGMMYRLMEGQVVFLPVFIGNIAGATALAYAWDHLGIFNAIVKPGKPINLITAMGPAGAIILTLALLAVGFESCPYPVIYTLETLRDLKKGQLLQVITDCPSSFRNVPEEVVKHGYTLEQDPVRNGQEFLFYIRA
ncbi:hypothetical protein BGX30_003441 [Mortierella sp. GBA39]|nr:hypothetical protein BGX30_003441 [Mortierella sp. GBA39]